MHVSNYAFPLVVVYNSISHLVLPIEDAKSELSETLLLLAWMAFVQTRVRSGAHCGEKEDHRRGNIVRAKHSLNPPVYIDEYGWYSSSTKATLSCTEGRAILCSLSRTSTVPDTRHN